MSGGYFEQRVGDRDKIFAGGCGSVQGMVAAQAVRS